MWEAAVQTFSRSAILGAIFIVVTLCALALTTMVSNRIAIRRRLAEAVTSEGARGGGTSLRAANGRDAWSRLIEAIEKRGLSLSDSNAGPLAAKLAAAGYNSPQAPRVFTLVRLVLTLGLPALLVGLTLLSGNTPSILKLYLFGAALAVFGLYAPNLFIAAKADRRREQLIRGFPDALDLMLVCVEAGLGLEAAFDRVGREMALSHPLISQLLGTVVLELRAGRGREEALRLMADRAGVDQIRSFATLLIQSNKLGSSIGQTLRVYAAEMRERRRLAAQEKAHRLPVLLSIPLVACMLPVMIGVLMLPALIRVVRQLLPVLSG